MQTCKLYLPVSAIPTTSFPLSAGGHVHACIGVGSMKPANAPRRPSGILSWSNDVTGMTVSLFVWVLMVMLCFARKASASAGEHGFVEGCKDRVANNGCWEVTVALAKVSASRSCLFFLCFLEGLGLSAVSISCAPSRLRFLCFFEVLSPSSVRYIRTEERPSIH
jgi:hypothetical protein